MHEPVAQDALVVGGHVDEAETRPGLAAQVAVIDELLGVLDAGELPPRTELRMLLYGYGRHADYDHRWVELLA